MHESPFGQSLLGTDSQSIPLADLNSIDSVCEEDDFVPTDSNTYDVIHRDEELFKQDAVFELGLGQEKEFDASF